jgi:hypothetical protein
MLCVWLASELESYRKSHLDRVTKWRQWSEKEVNRVVVGSRESVVYQQGREQNTYRAYPAAEGMIRASDCVVYVVPRRPWRARWICVNQSCGYCALVHILDQEISAKPVSDALFQDWCSKLTDIYLWTRSPLVFRSPVQSGFLTYFWIDRTLDRLPNKEIIEKTGPDRGKTAKNRSKPV